MGNIASVGKKSALMFSKTAIAVGDGIDLISEGMKNLNEIYEGDTESIHGGRQRDAADAIVVAEKPGGSFSYHPRYTELSKLFELALGAGDDDAWTPLETGDLSEFYIEVHHSDALKELYTGCVINELVLRSEERKPLVATPTIIATSAAVEASPTTPTYAGVGGVSPIMHSDLVVTGDAGISGVKPFHLQHSIKNNMEEDGFANSKNRQFKDAEGFDCDLEMEVKLTSTLAGYLRTWYNNGTNRPVVEVVSTYSNGGLSAAITFQGILVSEPPAIDSPSRQKYTAQFSGKAVWGGSPYAITKNILSVTIDDVA